jgi:hypothetical protein
MASGASESGPATRQNSGDLLAAHRGPYDWSMTADVRSEMLAIVWLGDISRSRHCAGVALNPPAAGPYPDSEWHYVPIRRVVILLEESLEDGTQWAVFQPNDRPPAWCLDYFRV